MFAYDTLIDNIQTANKYFINAYVLEKNIKESLTSFLDAQTIYAKQAIKTTETITKEISTQNEKVFGSFVKLFK